MCSSCKYVYTMFKVVKCKVFVLMLSRVHLLYFGTFIGSFKALVSSI